MLPNRVSICISLMQKRSRCRQSLVCIITPLLECIGGSAFCFKILCMWLWSSWCKVGSGDPAISSVFQAVWWMKGQKTMYLLFLRRLCRAPTSHSAHVVSLAKLNNTHSLHLNLWQDSHPINGELLQLFLILSPCLQSVSILIFILYCC